MLPFQQLFNKERNDEKMSERKAVIKNADMSEDMQQDAIDCATQALEKSVHLSCLVLFLPPIAPILYECIVTFLSSMLFI